MTDGDTSSIALERSFRVEECPRCDGTGRLNVYDPATFDGIRAHEPAVLEVPCPTCGARMDENGHEWLCPICASTRDLSREWHIDRLTDDAYPDGSGKPGVLMGECPVCGDESGVNGGPDGALECSECADFYAGRFSSEWFAYSDWLSYNDYAVVNRKEASG